MHFSCSKKDENTDNEPVRTLRYCLGYTAGLIEINKQGKEYVLIRVPFRMIELDADKMNPIRIDVIAQQGDKGYSSWHLENPFTPRLILGSDNPVDLGWLVF